jgi:hypothetical protein
VIYRLRYVLEETGRLKLLVQYLRRLFRRSFGGGNVNNFFSDSPPFPSYDVLTFMSLLLLWSFNGASLRAFVDVQAVEAQLSDSDSSTGNKNSGKNKNA